MAEHKRQHYVPRCHLKPFTKNGQGNEINLFNIGIERIIECAPVKGQCAKDYMYGDDLQLEKAFQGIEGEYARFIRSIQIDPHSATTQDLDFVRFFAGIQYFRTETAMNRTLGFHSGMDDVVFDRDSPAQAAQRPPLPDDRKIIHSTMMMGLKSVAITKDLKACIVLNRAKTDFVTSDDPAVFTSRYYF